jgi:NDP-sugar pyrophosphorylase family protein
MSRINHAVILAAGRGQRLMPLTAELPKAMTPYQGTTLIARGIDQIRDRIENIHITVGYKGAVLAEHVIHHGVRSVINTDGRSNSWWMFHTLLSVLDEPIFVLTCDNVVDLDFDRLEEDYFATDEPACMLVPVKPIEGLEGDWIFHEDHRVTKISRTETSDVYCSGIQVVNPRKIQAIARPEGDFYDVWNDLIVRRALRASRIYPERWFAVDTPAQLKELLDSGLPSS